ncbi:MAG TPA: hypothetical protein VFF63_09095 [Candidatus Babeliales bacterium]|nr:hypothetical protein [Candidatus Babeliales bacterium]
MREDVDHTRTCGRRKRCNHVGQAALALSHEGANDFGAESRCAPSFCDYQNAGHVGLLRSLEIDESSIDACGQPRLDLRVERSTRDRGGWPGGQERSGPYKVLVHALFLAWTSANRVAHNPAPPKSGGSLEERIGRRDGQTYNERY